jgi:predicted metal-dependent hydrolase
MDSDRLSEEDKMNTGAWVGILATAVVLFALIATLVPRIREHRMEQGRQRAIDEFHDARERDSVQFHRMDVQDSDAGPINSPTRKAQRR